MWRKTGEDRDVFGSLTPHERVPRPRDVQGQSVPCQANRVHAKIRDDDPSTVLCIRFLWCLRQVRPKP